MNAVDPRQELARLMTATVNDRTHWTYDEVRPLAVPAHWNVGQRVVADCSKGVQYLCKWAGAPDPMENGFANWGNSTQICMKLEHLFVPSELDVGDPVTFGPYGDAHAAMCKEPGNDPLLWSFGHPGAPEFYRLSQDRREYQLLRLPVAVVVTPQDRLRMRTGWYSWAAWLLGEGSWSQYGKASVRVRPNVPKRIPAAWWKELFAFLLARKRKNNPPTPIGGKI